MRLLHLEFQAIGPFAGRQVVPLEQLGADGLFLLEGPTGAGKSTIIDATVFALYGDVSGENSSKNRLVSTHRSADAEPFVELTFETGSGIYRVRRTPEFRRAKKRGQGETTVNATCRLFTLTSPDAEPSLKAGGIQEANVELRSILGLSKSQFTQTVVLPQGQFADFLRSKPEERRVLLQDIFGTQLFERIQAKLREQAEQHRAAVTAAQNAADSAAAVFAAAAWGDEAPHEIDEPTTWHEAAESRLAELAEAAACADTAEAAAQAQLTATEAALRAEQRRAEQIARRDQLRAEARQLDESAPAMEESRAELEAAERASRVDVAARARARAAAEAQRTRETEDTRRAAVAEDAQLAGALAAPDVATALEEAAQRWQRRAGELDSLLRLESGLSARKNDIQESQSAFHAARAEHEAAQQRLEERRAALATQREELDALRASADDADAARTALQEAAERLALHQERARLHAACAAAAAARDEAAALVAPALSRYSALQTAWTNAAAGRLAQSLEPGVECPVCGATEHPHPAASDAESVDSEAVDEALEALNRAHAAFQQAEARAADSAARLAAHDERIGADTPQEAQAAATAAQQRVDAVRRAADKARRLDEAVRREQSSLEREAADIARRHSALAAREAEIAAAEQQWSRDDALVAQARADAPSVAAVATEATHRAAAAQALRDAMGARERAEAAAREAEVELSDVLSAQRFPDLAAVETARREPARVSALRSALKRYDDARVAISAQLGAPELAQLDEDAHADPAPLAEAAEEARQRHREALEARATAQSTNAAARRAHAQLRAAQDNLDALAATSKPFVDMDSLARGDNPRQLTLATYVLLQRFEEIVERANERLHQMTDGRYSLTRTDEREGREKRVGLGLAVVDHASHDAHRDPATLSGGETFLASLSLALGLAEAVTAEAGGIELHTLFIDEGFGTLDPETLELVMQQLAQLRQGGRAVGIISHVTELKNQIPSRVSVRRIPAGGSTLTTTALIA